MRFYTLHLKSTCNKMLSISNAQFEINLLQVVRLKFGEFLLLDIIVTRANYRILLNEKSEIYFYNKSYFENLIKYNPDQILIAIAYKELTPVSVELIININDTLYSYLGGTLSEHFENRPNDFLKIEIL